MKHLNDQYFDGNRLREVGTPVADADAANKAYVDGKIPKLRTINGEQLEDSSLGDINIHDGFYFPNAAQDYDGNWYGAVVIGKQVWLAENLRTTHYADGTPIPVGGGNTSNTDPYYYDNTSSSIPLAKRGYFYNWPAVMNGAASSDTNPSGVQGIAPNGWHVPSDSEWKQMENYVNNQNRYRFNNINKAIAKSLAYNDYWENYGTAGCTGNNQDSNNATGFSAVPAGFCSGLLLFYAGTYAHFASSSSFMSDGGTDYTVTPNLYYGRNDVPHGYSAKSSGQTVRCVSDLDPIKFRNWYIGQYGSLQHHLGNGGEPNVQSDWNQTDNTAADYIKNKPTIPTVPTNVSAFTNDAGYITANDIPSSGGGNGDFTHTANATVSTSTHTVTFAANQRGSAMLTVSADLGLTIACNNGSDNYIWIKNTGSAEVDITISSVTKNNTSFTNVYVPSGGISIPAGGLCEIGIICNADGAFITARNDLSL